MRRLHPTVIAVLGVGASALAIACGESPIGPVPPSAPTSSSAAAEIADAASAAADAENDTAVAAQASATASSGPGLDPRAYYEPPIDLTPPPRDTGLHLPGTRLMPGAGPGKSTLALDGGQSDAGLSNARITFGAVSPASPLGSINPEATVRKWGPAMRACYQRGLAVDPTMAGKLVVRVIVSPDGEVGDAQVVTSDGLSTQVADCVRGVVRRGQLGAPGGTGATFTFNVTFYRD